MFKFINAISKAIKKPVYCIFIDTGEVVEVKNGKFKESFELGKQRYVINPDMITNDTLFFHSQFAEPIELEANNSKWKYYIDSTRFNSVYKNKVLDQMMYVQEKGLLQYILIGVLVLIGLVAIDMYLDYTMYAGMEQMIQQVNSVDTLGGN